MTDYNDGEWHHFNGSYPNGVHPESLGTYIWYDEHTDKVGVLRDVPAGRVVWSTVLKFRVTKPFREPRVIWVNEYKEGPGRVHLTKDKALASADSHATRLAVRYVEAPE